MNGNEIGHAGTQNGVNDPAGLRKREIRPRERGQDPLATHSWNNEWYSEEEVAELERRHWMVVDKQKWEQTTQGKLCLAFYQAFLEYKKFLEEHEYAKRNPNGSLVAYDEHKLFEAGLKMVENHQWQRQEILRRNLEKAQRAARCQHIYLDGSGCGSPRVKGKKLCRMHERLEEARTASLDRGTMEDPDSIQLGIKKLQGAIIEGKLDHRQVSQLAYTLQLAAWNVTRTSTAAKEE